MQGNENKNTNTNEKSKQTYRLSCLIRLLFHVIRCCLVTIKICGYMWLFLVFKLLQVCYKFVTSLLQVCYKFEYSNSNKHTIQQKPYHTRVGFIGWLINRIYNKQQYNDQSVNCCKQPIKYLNPSNTII